MGGLHWAGGAQVQHCPIRACETSKVKASNASPSWWVMAGEAHLSRFFLTPMRKATMMSR